MIQILHVDDDPISLLLLRNLYNKYQLDINQKFKFDSLDCPIKCLNLINFKYNKENKIILFCDLDMPHLSGWEVIDLLSDLDVQRKIDVYVVSSSILENPECYEKYSSFVKGFINKPIDSVKLNSVLNKYNFSLST